jgi:predicted site-specific integrase-resolvase
MPGQLLNQVEAAAFLGKDRKKVRIWTRTGVLPIFVDPDGGRVMYPKPALERWLSEQKAKAS